MKQNLHTHTSYCDGDNTPEEMIGAAIAKGFDSLGFSGHSYMTYDPFVTDYIKDYKVHINRLKEEYKDRIKIYLGLEVDMFSGQETDLSGFDFLIGSVHDLYKDGEYFSIDADANDVLGVIHKRYHGDALALARSYYETVAQLPRYGKFDIIGHFDLITKYRHRIRLADEDSKAYRDCALEALHALAGEIPYFEVNSGAIARGYRTMPYPNPFLIREFKRLGFGAIITSDCHDCTKLDLNYEQSAQLLRECGFQEHYVLTDTGFVPIPL